VRHWLEEGRDLAAPALEQGQAAKQVLQDLDKLEVGDPKFEALVSQTTADAREHIAYEEREVWPIVQQRMAQSELDELGEKMTTAKKAAPIRPHPHTSPKPGVLKTAGVAAAVVDKCATTRSASGTQAKPSSPGLEASRFPQ
jgi:hypothetical protein